MESDVPFNRLNANNGMRGRMNGLGEAKSTPEVVGSVVEKAIDAVLQAKYGLKPKAQRLANANANLPQVKIPAAQPGFFHKVNADGSIGPDWLKLGAIAAVVGFVGWKLFLKKKGRK